MFVLTMTVVGVDGQFTQHFDTARALVRWLLQTNRGRTQRLPVAQIVSLTEVP